MGRENIIMKNWMDEFVNNTDLSQNRPIKEVVYESLRKTLIESKIPAGERIIEKEYSDRLCEKIIKSNTFLDQLKKLNPDEWNLELRLYLKKNY